MNSLVYMADVVWFIFTLFLKCFFHLFYNVYIILRLKNVHGSDYSVILLTEPLNEELGDH
jgi:hypothetical protein